MRKIILGTALFLQVFAAQIASAQLSGQALGAFNEAVTNGDNAAIIPASSEFERVTLDTVSQWRFEVAADEDREACRVGLYPRYQNVVFYLRRG